MLVKLDETAASLYEAAYTNNRQAGYLKLQQFQALLNKSRAIGRGTAEGWAALYKEANDIDNALRRGDTGSGWLMSAARIKLTTDSLVRPEHALWLQYESVLLHDWDRVRQSWKRTSGDGADAAEAAVASLSMHLDRIEPAASMQFGSAALLEAKERLQYTERLLEGAKASGGDSGEATARVDRSLSVLRQLLAKLFDEGRQTAELPAVAPAAAVHPISWAFFLGTIICAVLTLTGWRKYRQTPYGTKPLP